jgi:hypothetical protein
MIPSVLSPDEKNFGERVVYESLSHLPREYTVFHSIEWRRKESNRLSQGEADFLVCHRKFGMLVIEVKTGGIEYNEGIWLQTNAVTGDTKEMRDPLEQADRSKFAFLDIVFGIIPKGESCFFASAVWFPSIERTRTAGELPPNYDGLTLFYEDLKYPQKSVELVFKHYGSSEKTNLSSPGFGILIDRFCPVFRAVPSSRAEKDELDMRFLRLSNEQNGLLDYLEEQPKAVIQGGAGTGKTMLATEYASRKSQDGEVLFLCFNNLLASHLIGHYKYENVKFSTIHTLAMNALGKDKAEWSEILDFLNNYDRYDFRYKHIIVDEGQDFPADIIAALSDIAEMNGGNFYVFYDKNQLVQRKESTKWLDNAECRLILNRNRRNTKEIALTSGKAIDFLPRLAEDAPAGSPPRFHVSLDASSMQNTLGNIIKELRKTFDDSEICILSMNAEGKSVLNGVSRIRSYRITKTRGEDGIFFTTARKFKGLEADAVILVDVGGESFANEEKKRLFYVASSRAKHRLEICFIGDNAELGKLANDVSGEPGLPKEILTRALNVRFAQE